jgi:hypothetical protein
MHALYIRTARDSGALSSLTPVECIDIILPFLEMGAHFEMIARGAQESCALCVLGWPTPELGDLVTPDSPACEK